MIKDWTAEAMQGCLLLITALMSAEHHTKVQGVAVRAVIGNTGMTGYDAKNCVTGASAPGDDTAQLMRATWREARKTVYRSSNLLQFDFQQFLFACQARILLKLNRPAEARYSAPLQAP